MREPLTREEAIELLGKTQQQIAEIKAGESSEIEQVFQLLSFAGQAVGYKPAFRALIMGQEPGKSIKW